MFHGQSLNPWHAGAFFLWIVVIHFCRHGGCERLVPVAKALSRAYRGDRGHAHHHQGLALGIGADALESCTGYLSGYQTPCVEGHDCECVRYTTVKPELAGLSRLRKSQIKGLLRTREVAL